MIYLMTEEEFNGTNEFQNWCETINGKYDYLPRECYILTNCKNVDNEVELAIRPFVAIDNRTGDCWVEEFQTLIEAYLYLVEGSEMDA